MEEQLGSHDARLVPVLHSLVADADDVVREAADWALARLLAPDERGNT